MRALILAVLCISIPAWAAPELTYRVIATYPHDPTAFTEGLAIEHGRLYESTGRNGQSKLTVRELSTLRVLDSIDLDDRDFGEGLAVFGGQIAQLTWKGGIGYLYDLTLSRKGSFEIDSEGWGLTYDGHQLIRSDGSPRLRFLDPKSFAVVRQIDVHDGRRRIDQLNELEWAAGRVFANVWLTDRVAVIDPSNGRVSGWLNLAALKSQIEKGPGWNDVDYVLNGIAYEPQTGHFFVTGKCWPTMFEIAVDRFSGSAMHSVRK